MIKKINFINNNPIYQNVINSIVDPIRYFLDDSLITDNAISNAVNIHFFIEQHYRNKVNINSGTSIFMSHGIADKNWRNGGMVKNFNYVCISGPLWMEKMIKEKIPQERLLIIGYPKLDPIFQGKLIKTYSAKKRVLYAPTHYGSPSSYPTLLEDLKNFPEELELISSFHPFNKKSKLPTMQGLVDADIVISDSGSLLYEAWALHKPVVFPDWIVKEKIIKYPNTFEGKIYNQSIGLHANNYKDLIKMIYHGLENGIDDISKEFIEGIFPTKFRGCSGEIAASKLLDISENV